MPRLSNSVIRLVRSEHPYLPLLLQTCREPRSARNELRWLIEYTQSLQKTSRRGGKKPPTLLKLCKERALGRPLQYILGNQPFGGLDILCRKNVLIPRHETEAYVMRVAELLVKNATEFQKPFNGQFPQFRILDLCTGSGCIALLLHAQLSKHFPNVRVVGIDNSDHALELARRNLEWNVRHGHLDKRVIKDIRFLKRDLLAKSPTQGLSNFELVISNPPYVAESKYSSASSTVTRSVRHFEPKSALVPPGNVYNENLFYPKLKAIAQAHFAQVLLTESGQNSQTESVVHLLMAGKKSPLIWQAEIWKDNIDLESPLTMTKAIKLGEGQTRVDVVGTGENRVALAMTRRGRYWLTGSDKPGPETILATSEDKDDPLVKTPPHSQLFRNVAISTNEDKPLAKIPPQAQLARKVVRNPDGLQVLTKSVNESQEAIATMLPAMKQLRQSNRESNDMINAIMRSLHRLEREQQRIFNKQDEIVEILDRLDLPGRRLSSHREYNASQDLIDEEELANDVSKELYGSRS